MKRAPDPSALPVTRRSALLGVLAATSLGCHARAEHSAGATAGSVVSGAPDPWGGLTIGTAGDLGPQARGGRTVVLLHGFGASGDDLLPLAQSLSMPRTRFIVPAAPLALPGGGRAWWPLEGAGHPGLVGVGPVPTAPEANAVLHAARRAIQTILRTVTARYAPESLFLAGFSQGAMLALDVALAESAEATHAVDRVAVLSGALLNEAALALGRPREQRPVVFVSHGREDPRLPFAGAENLKALLEQNQFSVNFFPFEGGHSIPRAVVEAVRAFFG